MRKVQLYQYDEGINDLNLFKAVILAGGPGSGKSFIAEHLFMTGSGGISPLGVKIVNSDFFFELGLEKANLPKVIDMSNTALYTQQKAIRDHAKDLTKTKQGFLTNGMLPIIIDGTGKDFEKISGQAEKLKSIGYDVSMVFVNTSLKVALERNEKRERIVDPAIVTKLWNDVQSNMGKFQTYFGKNNFHLIDNSETLELNSYEAELFLNLLFRIGKNMIEEPLRNPLGISILDTLRKTGGKYLSDLPEGFIQ